MILLRLLKVFRIEPYSDPTYRCWGKEDNAEFFTRTTAPFRELLADTVFRQNPFMQRVQQLTLNEARDLTAAPGRVFSVDPDTDIALQQYRMGLIDSQEVRFRTRNFYTGTRW